MFFYSPDSLKICGKMEIVTKTKLKERGQMTIPSKVRYLLNLEPGTEMIILARKNEMVIKPIVANPIEKAGMLGKEEKVKTVKELITKYKAAKVLRESRSVILEFVSDIQEVLGLIPIVMDENLLLPRDCIHLRTMLDCDCDIILSTDADFDHIKDIERLKPEEI